MTTKIPPELVDNQVIGRKNIIINGDMRVYQRNSSTTTSNAYVVDRFKTDYLGGTLTTTRESLSSSDTPYTHGFRNSVKLTNTSAGSTAASDFRRLGQTIEAQDLANSGWNYTSATSFITLSFWVKSSLAGTYSGDLYNEDGDQGYHFDFTLSANTWTKVTHSIKGGSGVVINNDNGSGMIVRLMPYLGTNYTTSGATAETWATYSSAYITGDYAQNWASTASATFEVTGVQLEVGDIATPFEHRSFGEELSLCQRYFTNIAYNTTWFMDAYLGGDHYSTQNLIFPTQMRASPTNNPAIDKSDFTRSNVTESELKIHVTGQNGFIFQMRAVSTGRTYVLGNTTGFLSFDAEI